MTFNIPTQITQGDRVHWKSELPQYTPTSAKVFIRGASNPLNLDGIADSRGGLEFTITEAQSAAFEPGKYQAQLVIFDPNRRTIGSSSIEVCPSFESLTELDNRSDDEKELEKLNKALSKGITEYRIGDRMVQYHSLKELSDRQKYLRNRIAIASGKMKAGGRNVGVRFSN